MVAGEIVSNEGAWDDPVPTVACTMPDGITLADNPPPGLKQHPELQQLAMPTVALVNGYALAMSLRRHPAQTR